VKKRCTKGQIMPILTKAKMSTQDVCRKHESRHRRVTGKQYGGTDVSEVKRLKELERENEELKKIVVEQALNIRMPKGLKVINSEPFRELGVT
jgi:putative transposase